MPRGRKPLPAGQLTRRELEVLGLLTEYDTSQQIADELDVSKRTVDFHLANIYTKLGVGCQTRAVVVAVRNGLIDLEAG